LIDGGGGGESACVPSRGRREGIWSCGRGECKSRVVVSCHPSLHIFECELLLYSTLPQVPAPQNVKRKVTINDIIEECGFGRFQWLYLTLFGLIYLSDAAEVALSGIILNTLKCEWNLSTLEEGMIPFMILVSYALGSVIGKHIPYRP